MANDQTKELDLTPYESPKITTLGSLEDLTAQVLDKVGSSADFLTPQLPALDGKVQPDI
jgi:hypothetical protein